MTDLKAAAEGYLNQGLSIVLMTVSEDGKKQPLHTWKQWETRRQTREEFDALPWLNAERFAVVCGVKGINGLYFTPIDRDNPDFDQNLLRVTQTERTPKGGHHFIYWSRVNARGKKLHNLKIELLGQGNLCLMYPSKDYVKVNDNLPTEIDDIKEVFESLAEKLGGHTKPRSQNNRIRFCCREALARDSHIGHLMRLAIASEYKRAGYPNEDIVQLFKSQDDFDHDKCLVQVESADPLKAARPETIREYGYCYPECQENCIETEDDKDKLDMKATLEDIHGRFIFKTPIDIEEIYIYNEGIYEPAEHNVKEHLEKQYKHKVTSHYVSEVLDHVRRSSYADRSDFNEASEIVPVANGLLNLSTLTLEPFTPDKIFTYKLNVEYKPEAKCPQWEAFIKEVVDSEDLPALQEYLGYCLVSGLPYHKFMWLYGVGRNGKGVTIRTLLALFGGKDHCSSLELEDFSGDRRFRLALLFGKAINVSSEPATHKILQTQILKKITGEDMIDAEIKNKQQPLRFMSAAKMFIMGNRFPKVNDDTIAFWDRVLFTNYPKSYLGDKAIPDIEHRWTKNPEEMSGLLNWMIEGLSRLLSNNMFTVSKTTAQTKILFKRVSNSTAAFLEDQCEHFPKSYITRHDFYETHLKAYCERYGLIADNITVFTAKVKQQLWIKDGKKVINEKNERVWIGVRVKPLPEEQEEPEEEAQNPRLDEYTESEEFRAARADGAGVSPSVNFLNCESEEEKSRIRSIATPALSAPAALKTSPQTEQTPEETPFPQQPKLVIESEEEAARRVGLIWCPECKARDKRMFFATDADLAAHMGAYHGS